MRLELVRDWMSRDILTVGPDTPAVEAGHILVANRIRRLPVVENDRLVGIVTYDDIRAARPITAARTVDELELAYLLARLPISEVMTRDPLTVKADETIGRAAEIMLTNKVGGVPVVDVDGRLVGLITESDIFRLVAHKWRREAGDESEPYARYGG